MQCRIGLSESHTHITHNHMQKHNIHSFIHTSLLSHYQYNNVLYINETSHQVHHRTIDRGVQEPHAPGGAKYK